MRHRMIDRGVVVDELLVAAHIEAVQRAVDAFAIQHRHHVVRAHRAFGKSSGFCLVRSIVIKHLSQRQSLVQFANEYSTLFINLLDRQLDPFFLELTRLGLTSGQRQHHAYGNIFGSHRRRIARCVRCTEPCKQQFHQC